MNADEVEYGDSLDGTTTLWRYMSIDKLVDLLATRELYFASLWSFSDTDPFEGYMPRVALKAFREMIYEQFADLRMEHKKLAEMARTSPVSGMQNVAPILEQPLAYLESPGPMIRSALQQSVKTTVVSCWHASTSESEALWRTYSDSGKGIALRTTVQGLVSCFRTAPKQPKVYINRVKYLDFESEDIDIKSLAVDGKHLLPLLKRESFSHEKEVRAFAVHGDKDVDQPGFGFRQPIDPSNLIDEIVVSPYATEPFISSVSYLCSAFGFDGIVVRQSALLRGLNDFLRVLD